MYSRVDKGSWFRGFVGLLEGSAGEKGYRARRIRGLGSRDIGEGTLGSYKAAEVLIAFLAESPKGLP